MLTLKLTKKYFTYPEYKNSGVEWLGNIPKTWEASKIVSVFNFPNQKVTEDKYEPLSVTYDGIKKQIENAAKVAEGSLRKLVKIGDIAINGRSDRKGAVGMSEYEWGVSLVYNVLRKRDQQFDSKYFHYLFRSNLFWEEFYRWGRGIVDDLWTTRASEMKRIIISVPNADEQKNIANYLDQKTALIDQTIEKKLRQIELLREKRTAVINQAVTKGLDSNVELVESGVEWIGSIPKGWRIEKLKYIAPLVTKKVTKEDIFGTYVALENVGSKTGRYIPSEDNVEPESVVNTFAETDILFGKLRPYLAKVFAPDFSGTSTGEFLVMRPKYAKIRKYLFYRILSQEFINTVNDSTYGAQMPRANWSFIGNLPLTVPSEKEQEDIGIFLDKSTELFAQTIQKIEKSIELLQEFKSSLISHVVTGKIKI